MITDKTKLKGLLFIGESQVNSQLDEIIAQKEPELLEQWFGYELAKDIQATVPTAPATALKTGFEYTDSNGDLMKLKPLGEILCYFVYFYYVREMQISNTPVGAVSALAENSVRTTPLMKLSTNFNRGADLINQVIDYVNEHDDVYTTAVFNGYAHHITTLGI